MEMVAWEKVRELGNDLRRRDMRRIEINKRVHAGVLSEGEAMAFLAPILKDYSELEWKWQQTLRARR